MAIAMAAPGIGGLGEVVAALREWQEEDAALQLHPGDVGWFWRFGAERTAAALRTWRVRGKLVAVGLLDSPDVLRLAIAPGKLGDEGLAEQLVGDLRRTDGRVFGSGTGYVEAPAGARVRELLRQAGWTTDQLWAALRRGLAEPVPDAGVRVLTVGARDASLRAAVQIAAFDGSTFTEARWHEMAGGVPYADARCLLALSHGLPVAAVTVWSAGPGRPGLLEPMGVSRDHRGQGYGRAICLAAAAVLQELGCSSANVCTRSANVAAVATYKSAGFEQRAEVCDLRRER